MPKSTMPKSTMATLPIKRALLKTRRITHKVRTAKGNVFDARKMARVISKATAAIKTVQSFTDPTKKYYVTATACSCPDFQFRRKARGQKCKHMRKMFP